MNFRKAKLLHITQFDKVFMDTGLVFHSIILFQTIYFSYKFSSLTSGWVIFVSSLIYCLYKKFIISHSLNRPLHKGGGEGVGGGWGWSSLFQIWLCWERGEKEWGGHIWNWAGIEEIQSCLWFGWKYFVNRRVTFMVKTLIL